MTTLTTPYPDIHRTIWQEFDKCEYWVQKQLNAHGSALLKQIMEIKENNELFGHFGGNKPFPFIEYKAPSGNRWINYLYDGRIGLKYDSVCYWETYGSFGAFIPFRIDGTPTIIITPSHFWQRVCERTDYKMNGVHTAMLFLDNNRAHEHEILAPDQGDTRRKIAIHWNRGTGYGVEVSEEYHIFEVRTFIPENSMTGHKLQERKKATENLMPESTYKAYELWDGLALAKDKDMDDAERYSLLDHLNRKDAEGIEEDIRKKGQKMMEEDLAKIRIATGFTEEEVIREYVRCNTTSYYVNKHGEHKVTHDPKVCELNVRLRMSELKRLTEQDWQALQKECESVAGDKMPSETRKHLKYTFEIGYMWGWSATVNWAMQELPEKDAAPLQTFKHGIYEQMKKVVETWATENFENPNLSAFVIFATWGFDLSVHRSFIILAKTLDLRHEEEMTVKDYLSRHGYKN